jgi:CBS domain-containing protein
VLKVQDIMTANPLTLTSGHTLKNAHDLTHAKGIRYLPIMENDELIGIVTHREMIASIIRIMQEHGADKLVEQEMKTPIMSLAVTDFKRVYIDQSLKEISCFFIEHKYGCLPVMDANEKLVGILTSSDFVKLSVKLLEISDS